MTPGQLVKAMSIALDTPLETVTQHDRNLAVAGLRTTGARGRNAPHVTTLDAARLLVAILGSIRTMDSVETLKKFESAVRHPGPEWMQKIKGAPGDMTSVFPDLPLKHNFVDALVWLMNSAIALPPTKEEAEALVQKLTHTIIYCHNMPGVVRGSHADILIAIEGLSLRYEPEEPGAGSIFGGITQTRGVHGYVLLVLGIAFRENGLNYPTAKKAIDAFLASYSKAAKTKKDKVA
jgi:hypothetical protein